jgi:hypothetical protein
MLDVSITYYVCYTQYEIVTNRAQVLRITCSRHGMCMLIQLVLAAWYVYVSVLHILAFGSVFETHITVADGCRQHEALSLHGTCM